MEAKTPIILLKKAFEAAVEAALPSRVLPGHLPPYPDGRLIVIGAGKAAASMAQVVERHYAAPLEGVVGTRYGHALATEKIKVIEAGHPVPDKAGQKATKELLDSLQGLSRQDLVLFLVSGGGSALLVAPTGITFQEKSKLTQNLLTCGADISEINCVRKHLSLVKGGRLAEAAYPAKIMTLAISDVVGDEPSVIASGPTVPDPSTYSDALEILDRYHIVSRGARKHFELGMLGQISDTPKPGAFPENRVAMKVVATNQTSLEAAAKVFAEAGIEAHILSTNITGEARVAGTEQAAIVRRIIEKSLPLRAPCVLLSGGETTVTVSHQGRGGPNGEFALALALGLPQDLPLYALIADSDGIDGSEKNAGAFLTPALFDVVSRERALSLLENNSSYEFFDHAKHLFFTGPTHTNVNDVRIVMILDS